MIRNLLPIYRSSTLVLIVTNQLKWRTKRLMKRNQLTGSETLTANEIGKTRLVHWLFPNKLKYMNITEVEILHLIPEPSVNPCLRKTYLPVLISFHNSADLRGCGLILKQVAVRLRKRMIGDLANLLQSCDDGLLNEWGRHDLICSLYHHHTTVESVIWPWSRTSL